MGKQKHFSRAFTVEDSTLFCFFSLFGHKSMLSFKTDSNETYIVAEMANKHYLVFGCSGGCRLLLQPKRLPHRLLLLHCAEQHQQESGVNHGEEQGGVFRVKGESGVQHEDGVEHGREQGEGGVQHGGDGVEQFQPEDEDGGQDRDQN